MITRSVLGKFFPIFILPILFTGCFQSPSGPITLTQDISGRTLLEATRAQLDISVSFTNTGGVDSNETISWEDGAPYLEGFQIRVLNASDNIKYKMPTSSAQGINGTLGCIMGYSGEKDIRIQESMLCGDVGNGGIFLNIIAGEFDKETLKFYLFYVDRNSKKEVYTPLPPLYINVLGNAKA